MIWMRTIPDDYGFFAPSHDCQVVEQFGVSQNHHSLTVVARNAFIHEVSVRCSVACLQTPKYQVLKPPIYGKLCDQFFYSP